MSTPIDPQPAAAPASSADAASIPASSAAGTHVPPDDARPLGPLALALSGGGYRAAGFHLGVLRFLNRTRLLGSVEAVSTVSGGTITGAAWVASLADGAPFEEFERGYSAFLRGTNVIGDALDHLTEQQPHGARTWPSLIRSAANVYARPAFLGERRLGALFDAPLPLREVIFNSTEFRSGLDFRFRRSDATGARIGNGRFPVPRAVAAQVRVADAVAASSCFPSAFEPFLFPDHFHWPEALPLERAKEALGERFAGGLPLMDGGIYDNQGVDALMLAYERRPVTILASDTDTRSRDLYSTYNAPPPHGSGWMTLRMTAWIGRFLFVAALASAVLLAVTAWKERREADWRATDLFLYLVPFLFSSAVAAGLVWVRRRIGDVRTLLKRDLKIGHAWKDLSRLTVLETIDLVQLRVTSLVALSSSIFLKRVRAMTYRRLYGDSKYRGHRMANLIYSLNQDDRTLWEKEPWLQPGQRLRDLARCAETMPTTLWFNDPAELDVLTGAGEASVCYTLLRHVLRDRKEELARPGSPLPALFDRLKAEWTRMNDPSLPAHACPHPAPPLDAPAAAD